MVRCYGEANYFRYYKRLVAFAKLATSSLENAFQNLNPRSLLPYLDQFETGEELQNFLDVANACILAAKEGHGEPIQNPHGFLFAQLRASYINPPKGYKSRKVRVQELKNQQLEEELATLQRLKEREQELQFQLFVAQLTEENLTRLDHEAQAQVKHNIGLSPTFQIQIHKDALLKQWFTQQRHPQEPRQNNLSNWPSPSFAVPRTSNERWIGCYGESPQQGPTGES